MSKVMPKRYSAKELAELVRLKKKGLGVAQGGDLGVGGSKGKQVEVWAAKGLGLGPNGHALSGKAAVLHCLKEFVVGLLRGAAAGSISMGALRLVLTMAGGKASLKAAARIAASPDTKRFALFVGLFVAVFRSTNSALTSITKEDSPRNATIAGALAGATLLADDRERRRGLALYLFCRGLDLAIKRLVREGVIPYWKHFENLLFGICNMPIMLGFFLRPDILERSYYNWIVGMGASTPNGMEKTFRTAWYNTSQGKPYKMQPCSCGFHQGPCLQHCVTDWFAGLGRAGKMYLPVHFLPLLLFQSGALAKNPIGQLARTGHNFAKSCLFLTTYVFLVKSTSCTLRHFLQMDTVPQAMLCGLMTGFSTYLEQPSRTSELMLYCMPRGLEGAWNYLVSRGLASNLKNFEVVFMALAGAALLGSDRLDFKPSYYRALCLLVGNPAK
mmetsp:Transcript_18607/g.34476  ORF Transcript_18607/g.34476 Transcript_18607/m.34476 type:complete len:443 (-) Transcript_18607:30-1358(-)